MLGAPQPAPQPVLRVSLVRLETYEPAAVRRAVVELLEPLGGLGRFVVPGARVVLKPNLLLPSSVERAVCTHPELLRAVGRLAREAGAGEVILTDSPGIGSARRNARRLGLGDDEPFVVENAEDAVERSAPAGGFHRLRLSRRMVEADLLINLPKLKTHGQLVLTGAVKNCFGAVLGLEKAQWHYRAGRAPRDFARLIVQIQALLAPRLSIVDGVIGMEGNGPGSGDPRQLGLLAASTDPVALDLVLARTLGLTPEDVPTLAVAAELGLLPEAARVEVVGPDPRELAPTPPWRLAAPKVVGRLAGPRWLDPLARRLFKVEPSFDSARCDGCGQCVEICAAGALEPGAGRDQPGSDRRPRIDRERCISCFCCQEICPRGAISVSAGIVARLLGLGAR